MSVLLTEPARQAAHVLLDTVVSLDEDHDAIALAFIREQLSPSSIAPATRLSTALPWEQEDLSKPSSATG